MEEKVIELIAHVLNVPTTEIDMDTEIGEQMSGILFIM